MRAIVTGLAMIGLFASPSLAFAQTEASSAATAPSGPLQTADQWSDTVVVITAAKPPTEVTVKGRLCPAMWRVTKGASTLWVMPVLTEAHTFQEWDSSCFRKALAGAREAVVLEPFYGVQADMRYLYPKRLKDVVSPEAYARFLRVAKRTGTPVHQIDDLTPQWAAYPIIGKALEHEGLSRQSYPYDLPGIVRNAGVPQIVVPLYTGGFEFRNVRNDITDPAGAEACLNGELDRAEGILDVMPKVIDAWKKADMRTLLTLFPHEDDRCFPPDSPDGHDNDLIDRQDMANWTAAMSAALEKPGKAVVVIPLEWWLHKGGALDQLQAGGANITLPRDVDADLQSEAQ